MTFIHTDPQLTAEREKTRKLEELLKRCCEFMTQAWGFVPDHSGLDAVETWWETNKAESDYAKVLAIKAAQEERADLLKKLKDANDRLEKLGAVGGSTSPAKDWVPNPTWVPVPFPVSPSVCVVSPPERGHLVYQEAGCNKD